MAMHRIDKVTENLHGYFSRDLPSILTIASGDTVESSVPDAAWNTRCRRHEADTPIQIDRKEPEKDRGHCLIGPIRIQGAMPGDTLEVQVEALNVGDHGWNLSGGWVHEVNERFGLPEKTNLYWKLDPVALTGTNQHGHTVKLRPFLGVMGMPIDAPDVQPTAPPRRTGGNLDCKELTVGASLFLPVELEGGMFSFGDGHAAQGDGEVSVTAIECPMDHVRLKFIVHRDRPIKFPRVRIDGAWITLGVHEDLNEAVMLAIDHMLDLLTERLQVDRGIALALASVAADVRITQIVNGVKGAHVVLKDDAITSQTPL